LERFSGRLYQGCRAPVKRPAAAWCRHPAPL